MSRYTPDELRFIACYVEEHRDDDLTDVLRESREEDDVETRTLRERHRDILGVVPQCEGCETPISDGPIVEHRGEPMHPGCRASARDAVDGRGVRGRREMQEAAE